MSISHSHSLEGKAEGTGHSRQVAISSSIGATIEAYDFIGYGTAAALYFGTYFFPGADPLTAWEKASAETKRLAEWIEGHEEVRVTAPGTDITLGIAGRKFIPCDGTHNMPDGEFFTGPVEDSVEGEVTFHLPAVIGGREVGEPRRTPLRITATRSSSPIEARRATTPANPADPVAEASIVVCSPTSASARRTSSSDTKIAPPPVRCIASTTGIQS